jgi:hypothetical protein
MGIFEFACFDIFNNSPIIFDRNDIRSASNADIKGVTLIFEGILIFNINGEAFILQM